MKHIVSFETAKALKEAGYPQPDFETGQIWYSWVGTPFMPSPLSMRLFNLESGGIWVVDLGLEKRFYAPSATEIIGQISLIHSSASLSCCYDRDVVCEEWHASDGFQTMSDFSENPAEAAAQLFILLNKRP